MILKTMLSVCVLMIASSYAYSSIKIMADLPGDSIYVDSVIKVTDARIISLIGQFPNDSLNVYIVNSEDKFNSLIGNSVPDWGAGVAIPYQRLIVIKSPLILPGEISLGELVAHEYAHIALARRMFYQPIPRWFNEGMAMYFSAEWKWQDDLAMSWAAVLGNAFHLKDIEKLNRMSQKQAEVAYAESYLAFKYFLDIYGKSGVILFIENVKAGRSFDEAFIIATGASCDVFENEFSTNLAGRYNLISLIFNSNLLWLFMALVIVVGFIIKMVSRKSRMKKLDDYDKLHSSDFDYGDEPEKPHEDNPWD